MSEAPVALAPDAVRSAAAGLRSWICSGACQAPSGAFVAWVTHSTGLPSYDYPEITGYALTYLAHQPTLTDHELLIGRRAGEWLLERIRHENLAARDGWDGDAVYLFDLGMMASGLLSFGDRVQDDRLVEGGLELVRFLDDELTSGEPLSPVSACGAQSERFGWSTHGIAHLGKLVQAFLLGERFGVGAAREHPAALVETVKALQHPEGRIQTDPDELTTMLHPHLYAVEGLWMWGSARDDLDSLERARVAVEWVWAQQLGSGGFPRSVTVGEPVAVQTEQCDVTAQAVRLAVALGLRPAGLDAAVARLVEIAREWDGRLGMVYQPVSPEVHLNTWTTLFAAQALATAVPGAPPLAWHELV